MARIEAIEDTELMAFADGVIEEPRFGEIAAAIEADPDLAERLEKLVVGGRLASAVYGPLADMPVPEALRRAVVAMAIPQHDDGVVPLRSRRAVPAWLGLAAAAAIGAVIAGPAGYLLAPAPAGGDRLVVGSSVGESLAVLLDSTASGESVVLAGGTRLLPIATFTDATGTLCREFELDGATASVSIACRQAEEWRVALAIETPVADDGYAPASSLAALDAYLASIEAGPPLTPDAEAEALGAIN